MGVKATQATCDGPDGPAVRMTCAVQLRFGKSEAESGSPQSKGRVPLDSTEAESGTPQSLIT